jgi:hypothetical protein
LCAILWTRELPGSSQKSSLPVLPVFRNGPSGAEQAAEKDLVHGKVNEKYPSAAKASVDFAALMARLKSCPFKGSAVDGVFPQPVKPAILLLLMRHG